MPRTFATRELLAPRQDVWEFLADPHNLADWGPGWRRVLMFDLRYHVASLTAVFLALVIGILVGVGISDRGLVDTAKKNLLQHEVANLQARLDQASQQTASSKREQRAAQRYIAR